METNPEGLKSVQQEHQEEKTTSVQTKPEPKDSPHSLQNQSEGEKVEQKEGKEEKEEKEEEQCPKPQQTQQPKVEDLANHEQEGEVEGAGEDNEQNWTDATESVAADEDLDVLVLDDDMINQMDLDSDEEEELEDEEGSDSGEEQEKGEGKKKEEDLDLKELEEQFVKGGESEQHSKMGKHDDFCISVAVSQDGKSVFTGGGDDQLLCFRLNQDKWQQFYSLKHTETVTKIQLSHDNKYVVTLTDNQLYCTDLTKLQSNKVDVQQPSDFVCHKQGGVMAVSYGYSVSIYNLKGLEIYSTYNLDVPPLSLCFSENGKQIIAACENKIRVISPKTGEILKVAGNQFHKEQISEITTSSSLVLSGCIGGEVFVSGLAKGNILGRFEPFNGVINCLAFTDNFALIAPQGDGLYWCDVNKCKKIFHSPSDVSVSAISRVHSQNHVAVGDIEGNIYVLDSRAPMTIVKKIRAGNTIHSLAARGSQLYAACEDGYVRVFDISKHL